MLRAGALNSVFEIKEYCSKLKREDSKPTALRKGSRTQSGMPAKVAGRSIKRIMQLREATQDKHSWESPAEE